MALPTTFEIMLPFLKIVEDGKEHHRIEVRERLSEILQLTEEDKRLMLPSGIRPKFNDRASWANTLLGKAGLIERPRRGFVRISDAGRTLLASNPGNITRKMLSEIPDFKRWRYGHTTDDDDDMEIVEVLEASPEERIEQSVGELHESLKKAILDQIKGLSPQFFEKLVVELLLKMGYGATLRDAGQVIGKSGDGGIDGIIKEDKLGLDVVYIQAKRWEGVVPAGAVRDFSGSLDYHGAKKGVFITTSDFTNDGRQFVSRIGEKKIVLINGDELAQLMIDHDVGVSTVTIYSIKRIDSDYFEEE